MTLDAFDVSKKVLSELYTSIAQYLEEVAPVVQNAVDSSLVKLNELKDATVVLLSDMQLTVAEIYQQYAKPTEDTKQK